MGNTIYHPDALGQFVRDLHSPLANEDDRIETETAIRAEMASVSTNVEPLFALIGLMNGLRRGEIQFVPRVSQTELAGLVNHILAESGTKPSELIKLVVGFSHDIAPPYIAVIVMMINLQRTAEDRFDDEWTEMLESDHSLVIADSGMSFRTNQYSFRLCRIGPVAADTVICGIVNSFVGRDNLSPTKVSRYSIV
jgi:hypothetical protein